MDRRDFLAAAALLGAAALAGAGALVALRTGLGDDGSSLVDAARLIGGEGEAIGDAYLVQVPEERDLARLSRVLSAGDPGTGRSRTGDAWLRYLADRIRDDFADGDTVLLDGWLLSRTEARACALARLA